jgi:signal recognition particle receptor subunit beta
MVHFRPQAREIIVKVVYYGPPLGGKTTNLRTLYQGYPASTRGELVVVPAGGDRTIFFDFLPMDAGQLRGMRLRVQLYTVPGQVHYNATRQVVLRGVDGVVFVADSQRQLMRSNKEAWDNLKENLLLQGLALPDLPHVLQYNKRDISGVADIDEMDQLLNEFSSPFYEAVASQGIGVEETLQGVVKLVARSLRERFRVGAETGLPGMGELTLTPISSVEAPPPLPGTPAEPEARVFAFAPPPPAPAAVAGLAALDEVFAVPAPPEPPPRSDEVTQKVKVTPVMLPASEPLPPLDDPFGEALSAPPAAAFSAPAYAAEVLREDDVFEMEAPPALPPVEVLGEEPLAPLGAEALLPEFAIEAPGAPTEAAPSEPELAFEAPREVEVPPVAVELPHAGVAAAIQRVVPRALAQYGEVRELELEVPVPAVWVGGKRMTLQLRLTLVPQEDEHGG